MEFTSAALRYRTKTSFGEIESCELGALRDHANTFDFAPGYVSEIHRAGEAFIRSIGDSLKHGAALFIDYGFLDHEYYHADRTAGTVMCHYRHRAHTDPFFLPGVQDITAHVNFSAMMNAARSTGLEVEGFTTQAKFLIACGITDQLGEIDPANAAQYLPLANQVQRLLSPAEMGELFKVLALGRGIDFPLIRIYADMTRNVGSFDYIIVGAGSAGCLLANRLTQDPDINVLLLEAGGEDNWIWIHIPVGYLYCIGNPRTDWMYRTEPDEGLNGRSIHYARGKVSRRLLVD